jgi:hypothetical protein
MPKIAGQYDSMDKAEATVLQLKRLGLVAFTIDNIDLRKHGNIFRVQTLEFGKQELLLKDKNGRERKLLSDEIFLILRGLTQTHIDTEKTVKGPDIKIDWAATALTTVITSGIMDSGIPIPRRVETKIRETSALIEPFLRLYKPESPEPSAEILRHGTNYSFLGAEVTTSSLQNFNTIITKLRDLFPKAVFDDRLTKHPPSSIPSERAVDEVEKNCKLLYFYHLATR